MPLEVIHAFGVQKAAAAKVNKERGILNAAQEEAVRKAAQEVATGKLDAHFPLSVYQSGSGTQTHMNVNEVLANRANELLGVPAGGKGALHPNDHINAGQSSNDTFPTVMHMALVHQIHTQLIPALRTITHVLKEKEAAWAHLVKLGRTHLQDAVPMGAGQEIGAFRFAFEDLMDILMQALRGLYRLPQGGTAVGTGLGAPSDFGDRVIAEIARVTGYPFIPHPNRFTGLALHGEILGLSHVLVHCSTILQKLGEDLRFLASGPRGGIGELQLPQNEAGSSIMPGKVNPTQLESILMITVQVMALHQGVLQAGARGQLQLNVMKPLLLHQVLSMLTLLSQGIQQLTKFCLKGLEVREEKLLYNTERSLMLVTPLAEEIGYDAAAAVSHKAHLENLSLQEAALQMKLMDRETFLRLTDPAKMAFPHQDFSFKKEVG
jgi:fumarate hydratase class II